MIMNKKKDHAHRTLFLLLTIIGSFFIGSQRLLEFYHNYFYSMLSLLFLCLGVGSAYFFIFFRSHFKVSVPYAFTIVFVLINMIFFIAPFIGSYYLLSLFIEYGIFICYFFIGVLFSFLMYQFSHSANLRKKETYWVYLGLILGSFSISLVQTFFSSFESCLIIILYMILTGFSFNIKERVYYIVFSIISGIFLILFLVFIVFGWSNISHGQKSLGRVSGIFSSQVELDEEKASDIKFLGLSNAYSDTVPTYKAIYLDKERYGEFVQALPGSTYPNFTPYKVVYGMGDRSKVLILNARGANSVYIAHGISSSTIDVVEKSAPLLAIIKDKESAYIGGVYHNRNTIFYRSSARSYVSSSTKNYDVITVPFNIGYEKSQFLTSGFESLFSTEAIDSYFNILNDSGLIHFVVESPNPLIKEALTLNIIKTLYSYFGYDQDSILKHLQVYSSGNVMTILIFKNSISALENEQYTKLVSSLGFIDQLKDSTAMKDYIFAILNNNQNILNERPYSIKVRSDADIYWIYKLGHLFEHDNNYTIDNLFDVIMIGTVLLLAGLTLLAFTSIGLKKTVHSKIQLPGLLSYFIGNGVSLGILIVVLLNYFYFIMQQELLPGSIFFFGAFCSFVAGVLFLKLIPKRYFRITISLSVLVCLIIAYFAILPYLTYEYLVSMSLMGRISFIMVIYSGLFFFCMAPFVFGTDWLTYFDDKSDTILFSIFFFSFVVGALIGLLFSLVISYRILMLLSAAGFTMSLVYFMMMDKHYRRVNFLYRRSRY